MNTSWRDHLIRALDWDEAHVPLPKALDGLPAAQRGTRPAGFEHSVWELLEHIRLAQDDILDFCINPEYHHALRWPDDYWPPSPEPPSPQAWADSIRACAHTLEALTQLVRDTDDLTALVPTGTPAQTYLRAVLLIVDHNAYHVGQIVAVRRALGLWP